METTTASATYHDISYVQDPSTNATSRSTHVYNTIFDDDSRSWVAVESHCVGTLYGVPVYSLDPIVNYCEYNYEDEEDRVEKWLLKMKSMVQMVGNRFHKHNPMHTKKYARSQKRRRR